MLIITDKDKKVYPNTERKNNYRAQKPDSPAFKLTAKKRKRIIPRTKQKKEMFVWESNGKKVSLSASLPMQIDKTI